jgi:hypothetical protein
MMIWPLRAIENLFLDERWLNETLRRAGAGADWDQAKILLQLERIAADQKSDVARILTERKLERDHKPIVDSRKDLRHWYEVMADVMARRAASHPGAALEIASTVEVEWPLKWREWVQGKRLLAEFVQQTPFRSRTNLEEAMIGVALEVEEFMPLPVAVLRDRLRIL